ncbi:unnamed protein product, partial [Sphagnum jensenii]
LSGEIPADIGNLRSLSQMDVSHNQGSGAIPQSRTHLTNLSILDLRQNSSSGVIPPSMANLQALTELVLFENHFTGIVPGNSGKDYNLTRFEASTNLLSGAVPVHVPTLDISSNRFTGSLPQEIGNLVMMQSLSTSGNNLSGTIPRQLSHLSELNELDLSQNNFTGGIPPALGNRTQHKTLNLSTNFVTGPIPSELSEPSSLALLDLSHNALTGEVPSILSGSPLEIPEVSYNNLSGVLPPGLLTVTDAESNPDLRSSTNLHQNKPLTWLVHIPGHPLVLGQATGTSDHKTHHGPDSGICHHHTPYMWGLQSLWQAWKNNTPNIDTNLAFWTSSNNQVFYPCYNAANNWRGVTCLRYDIPNGNGSQDTRVIGLYLDNININGTLDITNIQTMMTSIDNSRPQGLQVLSLRNNNITNVIYNKSLLTEGRNKSDWKVIVISTTIFGFLFGLIILALGITLHHSKEHVRKLLKNLEELDIKAKRFDYNELRVATKNFAEDRKLGAGAYGVVYKGVLANNIEVAVKQLFIQTQHGSEEFLNEILLISNLQHRNLVALKGYCLYGKEMLLVYEFVELCDLEKFLFDTKGEYLSQVMNWPTRMKICLGVAQGLYYLHVSSQTRIIHRDIKASNILLDKNLNPKIADFGLARPIQDGKSEIMTQKCAGTIGYLAPEYMLYGQLSNKADVYSFGILLLETISGTKNRDPNQPEDEVYLPIRAWKLHSKNSLMDLIDPRLQCSNIELFEVKRVLEIAILCVQTSAEKRPTMFRVVAMLAGDANVMIKQTRPSLKNTRLTNMEGNHTN